MTMTDTLCLTTEQLWTCYFIHKGSSYPQLCRAEAARYKVQSRGLCYIWFKYKCSPGPEAGSVLTGTGKSELSRVMGTLPISIHMLFL